MSQDGPTDDDKVQIIRTAEGLEVRINPDGTVTFENLPEDMIDVALALNPDAVLACDPADAAVDERSTDAT